MVCVMRSGNGDIPGGGPSGSEKNECEMSLERRSSEVIRIGAEVVWGFDMAKRRGSKISRGWR